MAAAKLRYGNHLKMTSELHKWGCGLAGGIQSGALGSGELFVTGALHLSVKRAAYALRAPAAAHLCCCCPCCRIVQLQL